ncbi:MAG: uroporphyrinogen-III synthase [Planctomycetota bacterium]
MTRDEPAGGPLSSALGEEGLVIECDPLLTTVQISDEEEQLRQLSRGDWLVLTSPRAIRCVSPLAASLDLYVAVVGESSRQAAEARRLRVAHVAPEPSASELWWSLGTRIERARVCFLKSAHAAPPAPAPRDLIVADLYEINHRSVRPDVLARCSVVAFTSPTAVAACVKRLGSIPLPAACLGETTARSARRAGAHVLCMPRTPSFAAFAAAIRAALDGERV